MSSQDYQKRKGPPRDQRDKPYNQGGSNSSNYQGRYYEERKGQGKDGNYNNQGNRNYQNKGGYNNNRDGQSNYQGNRGYNNQGGNQVSRNYNNQPRKREYGYRKKTTKISIETLVGAFKNSEEWNNLKEYSSDFPEIFQIEKSTPFSEEVFQLNPNEGLMLRQKQNYQNYDQNKHNNNQYNNRGDDRKYESRDQSTKKLEMFDFGGSGRVDPIQAMKDQLKVSSGFQEDLGEEGDGELLGGDDEDLEEEIQKDKEIRAKQVEALQSKKLEENDNYSDIDANFEKKLKNNEYIENEDAFEQLWLESKKKQEAEAELEKQRLEEKRLNGEDEDNEEDTQWDEGDDDQNQKSNQNTDGIFGNNIMFGGQNFDNQPHMNPNQPKPAFGFGDNFGFGGSDQGFDPIAQRKEQQLQQDPMMNQGGIDRTRTPEIFKTGFDQLNPNSNTQQQLNFDQNNIFGPGVFSGFQQQPSINNQGGIMSQPQMPFQNPNTIPSTLRKKVQQQSQPQNQPQPQFMQDPMQQMAQQQQQLPPYQMNNQPMNNNNNNPLPAFFGQLMNNQQVGGGQPEPKLEEPSEQLDMFASLLSKDPTKQEENPSDQVSPDIKAKLEMLQNLQNQQQNLVNPPTQPSTGNQQPQGQQQSSSSAQSSSKKSQPRFKPNPMYPSFIFQYFTNDINEKSWYYLDLKKQIQGPFSAKQMDDWYSHGHFPIELKVTRGSENEYKTIKELAEFIVTKIINGDGPPPDKRPTKLPPSEQSTEASTKSQDDSSDAGSAKPKTLEEIEQSNKDPQQSSFMMGPAGPIEKSKPQQQQQTQQSTQQQSSVQQQGQQQAHQPQTNQRPQQGAFVGGPNEQQQQVQGNYPQQQQQQQNQQQYQQYNKKQNYGGHQQMNQQNYNNNNYNNNNNNQHRYNKNKQQNYNNQGGYGNQGGGGYNPNMMGGGNMKGKPMQNYGNNNPNYRNNNNNMQQMGHQGKQYNQQYQQQQQQQQQGSIDPSSQLKNILGVTASKKNTPPVIDNNDFPTLGD